MHVFHVIPAGLDMWMYLIWRHWKTGPIISWLPFRDLRSATLNVQWAACWSVTPCLLYMEHSPRLTNVGVLLPTAKVDWGCLPLTAHTSAGPRHSYTHTPWLVPMWVLLYLVKLMSTQPCKNAKADKGIPLTDITWSTNSTITDCKCYSGHAVNSAKKKGKTWTDCPTSRHSNVDKNVSLKFGQHQSQVTILLEKMTLLSSTLKLHQPKSIW